MTVWFRIRDHDKFPRKHSGLQKSESEMIMKSAKIELCVTKLRLSGLGVGFFDLNI